MKKFNLLAICLMLLGGALFTACKKDKPTQEDLIVGKWKVATIDNESSINGNKVSSETYIGKITDFILFGNDNKVQKNIDGTEDFSEYKILPNNKIMINNEIGSIKQLTANTCTIYFISTNNNLTQEQTLNLTK